MKTNELKIGNFIDVGALYCPYGTGQVAEILADCVLVRIFGSYHQYLYDDIKGVPLTEEWLEKFGFELFRYDFFDKDDTEFVENEDKEDQLLAYRIIPFGRKFYYVVDLWVNNSYWEFGSLGFDEEIIEIKSIGCRYKYVHELQNLYFALTGNELEIKE